MDLALYKKKQATSKGPVQFHPLQTIPFLDYEDENDNPVEDKYRTLAHDLLRGLVDPALKPDRVQRDRLAAIIASPSHHPSREEKGKQHTWNIRYTFVVGLADPLELQISFGGLDLVSLIIVVR